MKTISIICAAVLCSWIYVAYTAPPADFPTGTIVTISSGTSLTAVGSMLKTGHAISSAIIFRSSVILFGGEKNVIAGDYLLDTPESVFLLAYRLVHGSFRLEPVKATIPEGWTVSQISDYVSTRIAKFDSKQFLAQAKPQEGYLFPDTYFFSPIVTPEKVVETMRANFDVALATVSRLESFSSANKKSIPDIITMASIVEAEARTTQDRQLVAGILWRRLSIGMALQVDSTISYVTGRNTYNLTAKDLKITSPYNTYLHTGLPPTPINNPGLDSIQATVSPTSSSYLYFFSGTDSTMHYAATLAQHVNNIRLYGKSK